MQTTALVLALSLLAAAPSPQAVQEKERGDRLAANGDLAGAREAYDAAIKLSPGYAAALNELGSLLYRQEKVDEAAASFKKAIAADAAFAQPHYNLGYIYRKQNNWKEAAASYRAYVGLEPSDGSGWYGLAESYKGLGDKPNALQAYEQFLAKGSKSQKLLDKAKAEVETLRKELAVVAAPAAAPVVVTAPVAAASPASPAAATAPAAPAVAVAVAAPAAVAAAAPAAVVAPAAAAAAPTATAAPPVQVVSPDRVALAQQRVAEGLQLRASGKARESLFTLQDAVNADPNNPQAVFELGVAYAMMNYLPQAIERWERILILPVAEAIKTSARDNIARARQKLAGVAPAAPAAPAAAPAAPAAPAQQAVTVSAAPAAAAVQPAGGAPAPAAVAQPAAAVVPAMSDAAQDAYNQGVKLYTEQKYAEAVQAFGRAIGAKTDFAQAFVGRGSANLAMRDYSAALADFSQAMRLDNRMASPVFGLAESLVALGRRAEAVPYYEAYVASNSADAQPNLKDVARQRIADIKK